MSFQSILLAHALIYTVKYIDTHEHVKDIAEKFDQLLDDKFEKHSDKIQEQVVKSILLPLARELMREEMQKFNQLLEEEQHRLAQEG